jgi:Zn finger protein HypA/HybF involved in hydrogenase expression
VDDTMRDDTMLDGNAVAGMLGEVFATDTTSAMVSCAGCGAASPMGAVHVYRGAGFVLRCPHCESVLMTLVRGDRRMWIGLAGVRTLQLAVPEA